MSVDWLKVFVIRKYVYYNRLKKSEVKFLRHCLLFKIK